MRGNLASVIIVLIILELEVAFGIWFFHITAEHGISLPSGRPPRHSEFSCSTLLGIFVLRTCLRVGLMDGANGQDQMWTFPL